MTEKFLQKKIEKAELEQKVAVDALKKSEERLARVSECFINFTPNILKNINQLTSLCGELLGATCALYNRLDQGLLCSWGQWNTPPDYNPIYKPEGRICYDVINSTGNSTLLINDLQQSKYAETDPNVVPFKLKTYMGKPVQFNNKPIGSLCVAFQKDFTPSPADLKLIEIIASAIGVEEKKKYAEDALKENKKKLATYSKQTEQLSLAAAAMLSMKDEQTIFKNISKAIVKYSDFGRVMISLFKDKPPFRDIIGFGGVDKKTIDKLRQVELPDSWYDEVFKQGEKIGRLSYYIPHTMKNILNQKATIYGKGAVPKSKNCWHPEDNLFVRMNNQNGDLIGVFSVDESKSGLKPSADTLRPLEIFSSLISQIIIMKKTYQEQRKLELQLNHTKKMEAIGALAGGIAHDFNNILSIIMGNTEISLLSCQDKEIKKTLELILEQTLRGKDLTQNMVTFAKDHEPKQELLKIRNQIDYVLNLLKKDLDTIEVIREDREKISDILADPWMIEHTLINLIQNSIHAVSKLKLKRIIIRTYSNDENICIEIEDNGCGIEKKHLKNIFEPSFTLKGSRDTAGQFQTNIHGTGYGLANVKKYIEQHNGSISVVSEPGAGTKFSIKLPQQ